ncbi:hypothetical protein [Sandarakinorhabdus sp.]|uniref:hypothetical protein n=1 Tax=Sandarakinorhabdus sp. TaxID=1916663 RepID=UPI00286DD928|nr:hypothetical protein [Sandarakinorhabdus sp.]
MRASRAVPLPAAGGGDPAAGAIAATVAVTVSLDDFYLTRARRQALAAHVHPLFTTRGVPGTHDLPLLRVHSDRPVSLPVFDKLADDRLPPQHWRQFDRIDLLIPEGWCIGARLQLAARLTEPIDTLEAGEDPTRTASGAPTSTRRWPEPTNAFGRCLMH